MALKAPGGENKSSMKGEAKTHKSTGSESIKSEEHVGSTGSGIRFKMPKDCVDHSNVRGSIGKE
jgi:hypothetical protein